VLAKEGNSIAPPKRPRAAPTLLPPKPVHPVGGRIRRSDIVNDDSGTPIEAYDHDDASAYDENVSNKGDNREDSLTEDSESDRHDGDNREYTDSENDRRDVKMSNEGDSREDTDSENNHRNKNVSNKGDNREDSESDGRDDHVNVEGDEMGEHRPPRIAIEVVDFSTPRGKRRCSRNSSRGSRHSKATKRSASSAAPSERGPAFSRSPSPIPLEGALRVSGGLFRGKAAGNVYNFADGSLLFCFVFYMFDDLVIGQVTRWM
jgi:hypothetical protein